METERHRTEKRIIVNARVPKDWYGSGYQCADVEPARVSYVIVMIDRLILSWLVYF
jgi:hypothetical protein